MEISVKKLILINGTMGVGKTATSNELKNILSKSVFLDGDWCWDMSPFVVNKETKRMVIDNITYVLNNYISCSEFENIIFCWVMHEQFIIDDIISRLNIDDCKLYIFSLICSEQKLILRIENDIENNLRDTDVLDRTVSRLKNYLEMSTDKIDVSHITANQAANLIKELVAKGEGGYI